jgi:EAL domain-containing protein (putative c-di-GMP-specific phosphodiesterase class I)
VDDALATKIAERILARLARPIRVADHELVIHASIGLTTASERDDQATLLRNADIALYQAKDQGKGVCTRYVPDMGARIQQEAALGTQLRQAVGSSQLYLVYQPMVHLATGNLVGAEALLRWQHPDKGGIEPRDFIPLAERTGLIVPIGRWLIHEACRQASAWQRDTEQGSLVMNVNVAGRQLKEPDFLDDVMAALTAARLPPARLCVEITENAVLEDEAAIAPLHGLREMGVSVALDDFGTGASSLGLLLTCPVTTLKLDRSFVESITTVPRQAAVARAVAEMATALQLQSVAEGIETPEQAAALRSLSYHHAQGYLFSRPLTADQFTHHWLANTPAGPSATLLSRSPPGAP